MTIYTLHNTAQNASKYVFVVKAAFARSLLDQDVLHIPT